MTKEEALQTLLDNAENGMVDVEEIKLIFAEMKSETLEKEPRDNEGITVRDVTIAFQFGVAMGLAKKYDEMDSVMEEVKKVIMPQPKTGQWIEDKCSACGKGVEDLIESSEWYRNENPKYCPFCGLKLVNSQESEEQKT